jgi:hypothetical protein
VRPIPVLVAVSAAALLAAACSSASSTTAGAPSGSGSASATASATAPASGGEVAGLPAADILGRAKTAFKKATSVHVTGGGSSGQDAFKVDMRYSAAGKAIGTIETGGQTVELRRAGQVVYIKADKNFWTSVAGAQAGTLFGSKYVKAPLTDKRITAVVSLTDMGSFIDSALSATGPVTKGAATTVNGTPAIGLTTKTSSAGSTLYVATTGEPVPLEVKPEAGGTDTGKVDFVDYGAAVDVPTPPAAQTVAVSALPGG